MNTLAEKRHLSKSQFFIQSFVAPTAGVLLILAVLYGSLWASKQNDLLPDFLSLYAAGDLVLQHPGDLYNEGIQREAQKNAVGVKSPTFLPFAYPPVTALLFAPLAALPFWTAYLFWVAINLVMLGTSIYLCSVDFQLGLTGRRMLNMGTIALFPVYIALLHGQTAILLLLLLTVSIIALGKNQQSRAGLFSALLFLKPQWLLLPLLVLLRRKAWRALFTMSLCVLSLVILSVGLLGWEGCSQWIDLSGRIASGQESTAPPLHQYNLKAVCVFFSLGLPAWILASTGIAVLVLTVWKGALSAWKVATLILGMILVSPQANPHDSVLMLLPLAALIGQYEARLGLRHLLLVTLLGMLPLLTVMFVWPWTGLKIPVMALVVLFLFFVSFGQAFLECRER